MPKITLNPLSGNFDLINEQKDVMLDTIFQFTADESLSTWSTGNNATFLGGGTLSGTFVRQGVTPMHGKYSYQYTQAAGSLNDYLASPARPVDPKFRGQEVTLYYPYTLSAGTLELRIYDVTNATLIPVSATVQTSNGIITFKYNFTIPLTCESIRVGWQVVSLSSGSVFSFDDVQLTSDTTVMADIANQVQAHTRLFTRSVGVASYTGALTGTSGNATNLLSYNSSTGIWTVLASCKVDISLSTSSSATTVQLPNIIVNGAGAGVGSTPPNSGTWSSTSYNGYLNTGDTFYTANAGGTSGADRTFVTATASNPNILTAPDTFSTDTAPLVYAPSSTYTLATLENAPVGTFITFTYAANGNTRTQTTTAPTQTIASMNANGIQIFTRAYNAASTAAQPSVVAIQVGKGMKGRSLELYKNLSKSIPGSLEYNILDNNASSWGSRYKTYDELTGVLLIDSGAQVTTNTQSVFIFSDITSQNNGYLVINASRNPALTGLNIGTVAARYVSSNGQAIGTTSALLTYETKKYDTHSAYNSGIFVVPESGYYDIKASLLTATVTLANTAGVQLVIRINGVDEKAVIARATGGNTTYYASVQDTIFLTKGETISVYGSATSATTMNTSSVYNTLTITKVSVG